MKCSEIHELLSEYVDGLLDDQQRHLVDDHCAGCARCAEELAGLKEYVFMMRGLACIKAPDDFLEKIHEKLDKKTLFGRLNEVFFLMFKKGVRLELVGVVATIMIVVYVFYPFTRQGKRGLVDSLWEIRSSDTVKPAKPDKKKVLKKVLDRESGGAAAGHSVMDSIDKNEIVSPRVLKGKKTADFNYVDKYDSEDPKLLGTKVDVPSEMGAKSPTDVSVAEGVSSGSGFEEHDGLREQSVEITDIDKSHPESKSVKSRKESVEVSEFLERGLNDMFPVESVAKEEKLGSDEKLSGKSVFRKISKQVSYGIKLKDLEKVAEKYEGKILRKEFDTDGRPGFAIVAVPMKKQEEFLIELRKIGCKDGFRDILKSHDGKNIQLRIKIIP